MRKLIATLLYWLCPIQTKLATEYGIVRSFLKDGNKHIDELTVYLEECGSFGRYGFRDYVSPAGFITVCADIYGYEVKIGGSNKQLLDCVPSSYGLTRAQADYLYQAILSCIPGSVSFPRKKLMSTCLF
jgi:hypothetical protein